MGPLARAEPGGTLGRVRGLPYLAAARGGLLGRRIASAAAASLALILAVQAVAAATNGEAVSGVSIDANNQIVYVNPTGHGWSDGIRVGQTILSFTSSDEDAGWRIVTRGPDGMEHASETSLANLSLQRSLPIGVGALILALVALALLRGWHRIGSLVAVVAVLLAATPIDRHGQPDLSTVALGATTLMPVIWLAARPRVSRRIGVGLAVAGLALVVVWGVARLAAWDAYEVVDIVRGQAAFAGVAVMVVDLLVLPAVRREFTGLSPLRAVDIGSLVVFAAGSLALVVVFHVSPFVIGVALLFAIVLYPRWRGAATVGMDRLLLSDLRERAAIEATEEERARLARDLHDAPLQQLAGVIRRLEVVGGADRESDALREVAGQLRAVATNLRPPVLDDLGLAAGLSFLADRATTEATKVVADLRDETGISPEERAPAGVELAVYRIAEEAVNNAILHSGASQIVIAGRISPSRVEVEIRDDGVGFDQARLDAAARRGRLGMASMRRRAALIGGSVELAMGPGAAVVVHWPR